MSIEMFLLSYSDENELFDLDEQAQKAFVRGKLDGERNGKTENESCEIVRKFGDLIWETGRDIYEWLSSDNKDCGSLSVCDYGVSDFETLRSRGDFYYDQTKVIFALTKRHHELHMFYSGVFGFNEKLFVSTIQCLFEGKKALFEGLAINDMKWNWETETCPVLRLNMRSCSGSLMDTIRGVNGVLKEASDRIGIPLHYKESLCKQFSWLIRDAACSNSTGKIVLLIEAYDEPLKTCISNFAPAMLAESYYFFWVQFYQEIRSLLHLLRFTLVTGNSRTLIADIFQDTSFSQVRDTFNRVYHR